jgi:hypothetical protein
MPDDFKLPSARQILESDAAAARNAPSDELPPDTVDDDFRRVMAALRAVLQMRGS